MRVETYRRVVMPDGSVVGVLDSVSEMPDIEPPVPDSVSPYQARSALLAAGRLPEVEAAVAAAGGQVAIAWEYGLEVRRDSSMIAALAGALGLTSEQVDALFRSAAAIG